MFLYLKYSSSYDFQWFSILGIFLIPFYLVPSLRLLKLRKYRNILKLTNRGLRQQVMSVSIIFAMLSLSGGFFFGRDFVRGFVIQSGTCLELTGTGVEQSTGEKTNTGFLYLEKVSCFSNHALYQLTQKSDSKDVCRALGLNWFDNQPGIFCSKSLREPTQREKEIMNTLPTERSSG